MRSHAHFIGLGLISGKYSAPYRAWFAASQAGVAAMHRVLYSRGDVRSRAQPPRTWMPRADAAPLRSSSSVASGSARRRASSR